MLMIWKVLLLSGALAQAGSASEVETRIVEYLKAEVKPGQRVVVSELVNEVFTSEEERAVLGRLFNTFFKIPLFVAQFQQGQGRPPTDSRNFKSSPERRQSPFSAREVVFPGIFELSCLN